MNKIKVRNLLIVFVMTLLIVCVCNREEKAYEMYAINESDIPSSSYIIGECLFTKEIDETNEVYDGILTTQWIMLASKTISSDNLEDMIIYYKNPRGQWFNSLTGDEIIEAPEKFYITMNDGIVMEEEEEETAINEMISGVEFNKILDENNVYSLVFLDEISETYYEAETKFDFTEDGGEGQVVGYMVGNELYVEADGKILANEDLTGMFKELGGLGTIEFNDAFDTSRVTNMSYMFYESRISNFDLSSFDTSNVTDMSYMFYTFSASHMYRTFDLSSFNTENVETMKYMFEGIKANELDLSSFNTSNVTDMSHMFEATQVNYFDLSNFDTKNVETMRYMFGYSTFKSLDVSEFNTLNVEYMDYMFYSCTIPNLDLSSFDTSNTLSFSTMFMNATITELNICNFSDKSRLDEGSIFTRASIGTIYLYENKDTGFSLPASATIVYID